MLKFPKTLFKRVPVFLINQFLKNKSFIGKAIKVQLILQSKICCLENSRLFRTKDLRRLNNINRKEIYEPVGNEREFQLTTKFKKEK